MVILLMAGRLKKSTVEWTEKSRRRIGHLNGLA